jgi:RimJ/RimL family protein N-acetyltransferase
MEITHRTARYSDAEVLLAWRNSLGVRSFSVNSDLIPLEEHLAWFSDRLERVKLEPFLVFVSENEPLGMSRLDAISGCEEEFEISILVDPSKQKLGVGTRVLKMTCDFFSDLYPQKRIIARVHRDNLVSQKLFFKAHFELRENEGEYFKFEKPSKKGHNLL